MAFASRRSQNRVVRGDRLLEARAAGPSHGEVGESLKERGAGGLITLTRQPPGCPAARCTPPETALAHVAGALSGAWADGNDLHRTAGFPG